MVGVLVTVLTVLGLSDYCSHLTVLLAVYGDQVVVAADYTLSLPCSALCHHHLSVLHGQLSLGLQCQLIDMSIT